MSIQYKIRFPDNEVMQKTYESNVRRFASLLGVDEDSQEFWYQTYVQFMPVTRKDETLYAFNDTRDNESAIFNEHGVDVYKNFNTTGEFV